MELKQAIEYGKMAESAKKEIGKLAESDEMIVLLYQEVVRLQGELQFEWEQAAGSSL